MDDFWSSVGSIVIIGLVIWGCHSLWNWAFGNSNSSPIQESSYSSSPSSTYSSGLGQTIDRQDAIDENWDEIKEYLNGTDTVNACSSESGNCYDLEADISRGSIDQIHFTNGGYLDFSADIDSNGDASDTDQNGNNWDFNLDMASSIVDDAISQWADANNYTIQ